jgi:ankyrin repeat protein
MKYGKMSRRNQKLVYSVYAGDLKMAREALDDGANPNISIDDDGDIPLSIAIHKDDIDMVSLLLDRGADTCSLGHVSLDKVRLESSIDIIILLYKKGSFRPIWHELLDLVVTMKVDRVKKIISGGVDIDTRSGGDYDETILTYISSGIDIDPIVFLLDNGANINATNHRGRTPLMIASRGGAIPLVNLYLDRGANINTVDHDGRTAYDLASTLTMRNIIGSYARSMHTYRYRSPTYMSSLYRDVDLVFIE